MTKEEKAMKKSEKQRLIEIKFKNKKEIATKRAELKNRMIELKSELQAAKTNEIKAKQRARVAAAESREEIKRKKLSLNNKVKEEQSLVKENQILLKEEKSKFIKENKLKKIQTKTKISEEVKLSDKNISLVKKQIAAEKIAAKIKLEEEKQRAKQRREELHKKLLEENQKNDEMRIEQAKVIGERKRNIFEQKKNLEQALVDKKIKLREERENKIKKAAAEKMAVKTTIQMEKIEFEKEIQNIKSNTQEEGYKNKLLISEETIIKEEIVKEADAEIEHIKAETKEIKEEQDRELSERISKSKNMIEEHKNQVEQDISEIKATIDQDEWEIDDAKEKEIFEGAVLNFMSKGQLKKFNNINKKSVKVSIDKLKLSSEIIEATNLFEELLVEEGMINLNNLIKYVAFIEGEKFTQPQIKARLASVVVAITKGRTLQFGKGYYSVVKTKGVRYIKRDSDLLVSGSMVVSLPKTDFFKELQSQFHKKIQKGAVIQVTNNLAIGKVGDRLTVLNGLAYMK